MVVVRALGRVDFCSALSMSNKQLVICITQPTSDIAKRFQAWES